MVKEIKETKEVIQETVVDEELYCDFCGKLIGKRSDKKYSYYYELFTGHHEWGNDSVDSFEHQDCCEECITDQFVKYLSETVNEYPTAFFNVDRTRF